MLELTPPGAPDAQTIADVALAAHALAYVVIANRRFTDLFAWGQRSVQLSLAAEIQHRLLPGSYTCEAGQFTLAAWLEPAGKSAATRSTSRIERDTLHLSMTDAMGHAVGAAVLATVLVGALRNARRAGRLARRAGAPGQRRARRFRRRGGFVTGQLVRIDLRAGTATIVNAGHPPPLRLRDGRVERGRAAGRPAVRDRPRATSTRCSRCRSSRATGCMFVTDGMLERNAANIDIGELMVAGADDASAGSGAAPDPGGPRGRRR